MISPILGVVAFLARQTKIRPAKKRRHRRNDVVVSIVVVQINGLLRFGAFVDNGVKMVPTDNDQCIAR